MDYFQDFERQLAFLNWSICYKAMMVYIFNCVPLYLNEENHTFRKLYNYCIDSY